IELWDPDTGRLLADLSNGHNARCVPAGEEEGWGGSGTRMGGEKGPANRAGADRPTDRRALPRPFPFPDAPPSARPLIDVLLPVRITKVQCNATKIVSCSQDRKEDFGVGFRAQDRHHFHCLRAVPRVPRFSFGPPCTVAPSCVRQSLAVAPVRTH